MIPICDKCHRRIHGEGGSVFSKDELYGYKAAPKKPAILRDRLPLEEKRRYSFFIGGNFVADGQKASLFGFPGGHSLTSIDTSLGILRLSILAGIQNNEPFYLIRENELVSDCENIWDMRYSGSSLKIWRVFNGKKQVFVDLVIEPDVIILRRMSSSFNGKVFRVYKLRAPQKRQVDKIASKVNQYEELCREKSAQIDSQPRIGGVYDGIDIDAHIKQARKDILKTLLEQELRYGLFERFDWEWPYYQWVLQGVLKQSPVFQRPEQSTINLPPRLKALHERIAGIKAKYKEHFEELGDVVVEYDGMVLSGNLVA